MTRRQGWRALFGLPGRTSILGIGLMALGYSAGWWVSRGGGWVAAEPVEATEAPVPLQKRDPFIPLVRDGRLLSLSAKATRVTDVNLNLSGILWDPNGHSLALINETELGIGDTIQDYRVSEIRQNAVVLTHGDQTIVLQIAFDEVANPARAPSKP